MNRRCHSWLSSLIFVVLASATHADSNSAPSQKSFDNLIGYRYCELIAVSTKGLKLKMEVYSTMSVSDCGENDLADTDTKALKKQLDVLTVETGGPRFWVANSVVYNDFKANPDTRTLGALEVTKVVEFTLSIGAAMTANKPYQEITVVENRRFGFEAGSKSYELHSPEGQRYQMLTYSHAVSDHLATTNLPALAQQLDLPKGWQFVVREMSEPEWHERAGQATVLTDELDNSYLLLE